MPPRDFMGALRSLGVANAKKPSSIQPIPLLKGRDGEILDTADKVRDCWRSYFQEQEDGMPSDDGKRCSAWKYYGKVGGGQADDGKR